MALSAVNIASLSTAASRRCRAISAASEGVALGAGLQLQGSSP